MCVCVCVCVYMCKYHIYRATAERRSCNGAPSADIARNRARVKSRRVDDSSIAGVTPPVFPPPVLPPPVWPPPVFPPPVLPPPTPALLAAGSGAAALQALVLAAPRVNPRRSRGGLWLALSLPSTTPSTPAARAAAKGVAELEVVARAAVLKEVAARAAAARGAAATGAAAREPSPPPPSPPSALASATVRAARILCSVCGSSNCKQDSRTVSRRPPAPLPAALRALGVRKGAATVAVARAVGLTQFNPEGDDKRAAVV